MFPNRKSKRTNGPWIVLRGNPETSVTVCWTGSKKKESVLLWGESESSLPNRLVSTKPELHSVIIDNLSPGTEYFYSIQENLILFGSNKVFKFRTQTDLESDDITEFIVAGDLQPKNSSTLETNRVMAQQIHRENPDFIVQTGDLVQIGSQLKYWNFLLQSLPLMASSRPLLPVVGNHEYYFYHSTKKFRAFFPYSFPGRKSVYYSKDIGSVHIIFLDSYDDGFAGMSSNTSGKQMEWLAGDLVDAEKRGAGWIFVILHQSVISTGEYPGDIKLQKLLLPIMAKFNVDAVFWGHAHLYEHWHYQYGKNGYLLSPRDLPGKSPIDFFCIGSSGASLESNYRLFTHKNFKRDKPEWFSVKEGRYRRKTSVQYPWNRKLFLEGITDRHYYHFPFNESGNYSGDSKISYNTENEWFGYQYGENTLHYAKVVIKNNLCTISIHYPDGTLLTGPEGGIPQKFYLRKKRG